MKKIISILMVVMITLFCGVSSAFNVPAHDGFVNDYAGKLSAVQLRTLNNRVQAVNEKTANEIGVMIISSLDGESIEDVTHETFKKWGVGKAGLDNGVLLVIAVNDRKMRIQTGKGVEGDLTDLQTQDIQDHMKPYLRKNDFYGAVNLAVDEISSSIESRRHHKASSGVATGTGGQRSVSCQASAVGAGYGVGVVALFILAVLFVVRYARRSARKEQEEMQERSRKEAARYLASQARHLEPVRAPVMSHPAMDKKETLQYSPVYSAPTTPAPAARKPVSKAVSKPRSTYVAPVPSSSSSSSSYDSSSSYSSGSFDTGSFGGSDSGSFGGGDSGGGGSSSDW